MRVQAAIRSEGKFKPAALYFALVLGAGFVLGTIRVPFLVPRMGERYPEFLEMPIGFTALTMSVLAELQLAAVLQDPSIGQYIASRDPISGTVYLFMLLLFVLMPSILAHTNGDQVGSGHQLP